MASSKVITEMVQHVGVASSKVITEMVQHGEIPVHIGERDVVADSCTKYQERGVRAPRALQPQPPGRPAGLPGSQMSQGVAVNKAWSRSSRRHVMPWGGVRDDDQDMLAA